MIMKAFLLFSSLVLTLHGVAAVKEFPELNHIKSKTPLHQQADAVKDLIGRVLGSKGNQFKAVVNESIGPSLRDTFNLVSDGSVVTITGTSGVAAAMGFYYYLKVYCGCQYTWAGAQLNLPSTLPVISSPGETITSHERFRYYQNVCTVSYSFVWWNWTRWEREIDWMAINGINLPLAFNGQEAIFQRVYTKMGITEEELSHFFTGPAFMAWGRMGNMRGWGGPMPQAFIKNQLAMQHKIVDRMRSLGMIPVLPAFAGHVPEAITRLYPNISVSRLSDWGRFQDKYCCTYLLDFKEPLFKQIGYAVISEMQKEFGWLDHIYNTDTFNEMPPSTNDTTYLREAGRIVFESMTIADPQAIWLMQGWLFQEPFWKQEQVKALLTSVPQGKMIVLDLGAAEHPVYDKTQSFYGQPFIWCMLHNFGGTMELFGQVKSVVDGPFIARNFPNSTMIGTGLTMEGINQNEVIYELMNENAWAPPGRNMKLWFSDFAKGRYGGTDVDVDTAWQLLRESVYNSTDNLYDLSTSVLITTLPRVSPPVHQTIWYNTTFLYKAWEHLVAASEKFSNSVLFRYDLVDVTRNSLQILSIKYYDDVINAYKAKDSAALADSSVKLIDLFYNLELILASDTHFLLGHWIQSSKAWGTNDDEKSLMAFNARNQITLWGPVGNVRDYACKQWAGLVGSYYVTRYQLFIKMLKDSLKTGKPFNQTFFEAECFVNIELPFSYKDKPYPTTPQGNSVALAHHLYGKYMADTRAPIFDRLYEKYKGDTRQSAFNRQYDNPILRKYSPNIVVQ